MSSVPATIEQCTPAWLTERLQRANVLPTGSVVAVSSRNNAAFNSEVAHLRVTYTPDAPSSAPHALLLKRNNQSDWGRRAGADEVAFYQLVTSLPDHPPMIAPCYGKEYDEASGNSYLLLLDLSATHHHPVTRDQQISIVEGIPTPTEIEQTVTALARFHAYWWEHPILGKEVIPIHRYNRGKESFSTLIALFKSEWDDLYAAEKSWLPGELCDLYEHALPRLPHYWNHYLGPRFTSLRHMTATHGDSYFCNFLCPNDPEHSQTYLLDWQSPQVFWGTEDVANMCATFWTPEQRHEERREERILRLYLDTLHKHGVPHYTWDDLWQDYRCAVIDWFFQPVHDCAEGSSKSYWWPKMQCLAANYRDLGCADLLDS